MAGHAAFGGFCFKVNLKCAQCGVFLASWICLSRGLRFPGSTGMCLGDGNSHSPVCNFWCVHMCRVRSVLLSASNAGYPHVSTSAVLEKARTWAHVPVPVPDAPEVALAPATGKGDRGPMGTCRQRQKQDAGQGSLPKHLLFSHPRKL